MLCDASENAILIYDKASRLPRTSTRLALKQANGIQVDGSFPANSSKASFCYAFHDGRPLVLKLYDNQLNAAREKDVIGRLGDARTCAENYLVYLYSIEVLTESSQEEMLKARILPKSSPRPTPFFALASPVYVMTLDRWPSPMFPKDVCKMGIQILSALNRLHTLDMCHNDVKPDNIFIDQQGDFFLGDFGACDTIGAVIRECTREYMPDSITRCSKQSDYALLQATILKMCGITIPSSSTLLEFEMQCHALFRKDEEFQLLCSKLFRLEPIDETHGSVYPFFACDDLDIFIYAFNNIYIFFIYIRLILEMAFIYIRTEFTFSIRPLRKSY